MIAPDGAVAAVDVRGGGPGTRETEALRPGNLVEEIFGICLSGGSAYGLAAADGVMAHLEQRRLGFVVGDGVVPVVPAAVIFDLGRGGEFANRPDAEFGRRAARSARPAPFARGAVGAGTGARSSGLQGGVGTASTLVDVGWAPCRVAALVVVNSAGSAFDRSTGLPWEAPRALRRPSAAERKALASALSPTSVPLNTTIGVVATDALLTRPEAERLAMAAHDGLARAVRPAHGLTDGDTIFALSTGAHTLPPDDRSFVRDAPGRTTGLSRLAAAAADVFAAGCADAVLSATSIGDAPAYRDLCPSAFRAVAPDGF